jgi:hypothetical protein
MLIAVALRPSDQGADGDGAKVGDGSGVDPAAGQLSLHRGAAERDHPGHVDDRPLAAGHHPGHRRADQHCRGDDLDVHEFARLDGRKFGDRHVVRHTGIVDEHRERPRRAHLGDYVDPFVGRFRTRLR